MHRFGRTLSVAAFVTFALTQAGCVAECSCQVGTEVFVMSSMRLTLENLEITGGESFHGGFRCSGNTCSANPRADGTYEITVTADGHEPGTASITQIRNTSDGCCGGTFSLVTVEITLRAIREVDAGATDAGATDAGSTDAGATDAGGSSTTDASADDAG